ncbi:AsnC family transcriptional regulator [Rhodococcus hoagii]|nr:AsnC family transcriptional regulator [Prescottella equi]
MLTIDRLDVDLLRILERDARTGVVELAATVGVSRNTVQARIKRLEEAQLLAGYRPEFDMAKAGLVVQAYIALETEQSSLAAITEELIIIPQVLEVHAITGREDLLVRVAAATQPDLQQLIERIVSLRGVVHSNTSLTLTTPLRYRGVPALAEIAKSPGRARPSQTHRSP